MKVMLQVCLGKDDLHRDEFDDVPRRIFSIIDWDEAEDGRVPVKGDFVQVSYDKSFWYSFQEVSRVTHLRGVNLLARKQLLFFVSGKVMRNLTSGAHEKRSWEIVEGPPTE